MNISIVGILGKIPFLEIAKHADDQTVLKMLQVNRFFNNLEFFQILFKNRYPYLIQFKKDYEDWRSFFVRMIYYISKLKKEFDFDYVPVKSTNPEMLYKTLVSVKRYEPKDIDLVKKEFQINYMIESQISVSTILKEYHSFHGNKGRLQVIAIRSGNVELADALGISNILEYEKNEAAIKSKNPEMIKYVQRNNNPIKISTRLLSYAYLGDIQTIENILNNCVKQLSVSEANLKANRISRYPILYGAVEGGQLEVLKKYLPCVDTSNSLPPWDIHDIIRLIDNAINYDHLEILQYLLDWVDFANQFSKHKMEKIYEHLKECLVISDTIRKYIKSILHEKYKTKKAKDEKKKGKK